MMPSRPKSLVLQFLDGSLFATLTKFHPDYTFPVAYDPLAVKNGLDEVVSNARLSQLRLAETEKHAHTTFSLNDERDQPFAGVFDTAVKAVKTFDKSLQSIVDALKTVHGRMLITADHGNIELMND